MAGSALDAPQRLGAAGGAGAPRLRLVAKASQARQPGPHGPAALRARADRTGSERAAAAHAGTQAAGTQQAAADAPVLIAGRNADSRAQVHRELRELMPDGTCFCELSTLWELIELAPRSRAVFLSGELDEVTADSLLHTLAHRHPELPVVSLAASAGS